MRQIPPPFELPTLPYLRLRFRLRSVGEARLPRTKGSLLRGAFGHALRRAVCSMGRGQACAPCPLRPGCAYTRLFETSFPQDPPTFVDGLPASPRPFVFEPGEEETRYRPGDTLTFQLLLFGTAVDLQGFALLAVERMATAGLGRRRYPFALEEAAYQSRQGPWTALQGGGGKEWQGPAPGVTLKPEDLPPGPLTLRFLTPTRIKIAGSLAEGVGFPALAERMARRVREMAHFYGTPGPPGTGPAWDLDTLVQRAEGVQVVDSRLSWRDWERYSSRQETRMALGGFVGTLRLQGDLTPFHPLLRAAEVLHIGKATTFGLGKVQVSSA